MYEFRKYVYLMCTAGQYNTHYYILTEHKLTLMSPIWKLENLRNLVSICLIKIYAGSIIHGILLPYVTYYSKEDTSSYAMLDTKSNQLLTSKNLVLPLHKRRHSVRKQRPYFA